jgi:hypothetical protein
MATKELQRAVAQWMLDNYYLFTELLELAIFVHRRCSHINWSCTYGHGDLSLDGQLNFNMLSPLDQGDGYLLAFTFELWRHNGLQVSYVDMNNPEIDNMFSGCTVFDLLGEEDFIHFERCDMSDVPRAHKLIRERLKEFAE